MRRDEGPKLSLLELKNLVVQKKINLQSRQKRSSWEGQGKGKRLRNQLPKSEKQNGNIENVNESSSKMRTEHK